MLRKLILLLALTLTVKQANCETEEILSEGVNSPQAVSQINLNFRRLEQSKLDVRPKTSLIFNKGSFYDVGSPTIPVRAVYTDTLTVTNSITGATDSTLTIGSSGNEVSRIDVDTLRVNAALNLPAVSDSTSPAGNYFYSDNMIKAWARFDGTAASPSTADDLNFSNSITKNGTGDYTLRFSRAFANTNYACVGSAAPAAGQNVVAPVTFNNGSVRIQVFRSRTEDMTDSTSISLICIGDQQ